MPGTSLDVTSAQYTGGRPRPGLVYERKGQFGKSARRI
jgi:hypothetical protein